MTHPDDTVETETTPSHLTPGYKRLKFIVVFMGVLIIIGVATLIVTIVYRVVNSGATEKETPLQYESSGSMENFGDLTIFAPEGGVLKSVSGNDKFIYLHFGTPEGDIVKVINIKTGKGQGSLTIKPAK